MKKPTIKQLQREIDLLSRELMRKSEVISNLDKEVTKVVHFDNSMANTFLVAIERICDALAHVFAVAPKGR